MPEEATSYLHQVVLLVHAAENVDFLQGERKSDVLGDHPDHAARHAILVVVQFDGHGDGRPSHLARRRTVPLQSGPPSRGIA